VSPQRESNTAAQGLLIKATEVHRAGDVNQAESIYREVLNVDPQNNQARLLVGVLCAQSNREVEAADYLSTVVTNEPQNFSALSWLAGVLGTLERYQEATEMAKRALGIRPNDVNTWLHLATGEFGADHFEDAAHAFKRVIQLEPRLLTAYYGLATTFLKLGEPLKARLVMVDASYVSSNFETLLKLAEVCLACDLWDEALAATDRILRSDPKNIEALMLKSRAYRIGQQEKEEDTAIDSIVRLAPDDFRTPLHRGRRLQGVGKFKDAEHEFLRSIELNPHQGVAYYSIVSGRKVTSEDIDLIDAMESLARDEGLSEDDRAHLEYGLGKAYDNLGDYGRAMAHFDIGNRLMSQMRPWTRRFEPEVMRHQFEQLMQIFTFEELRRPRAIPEWPVEPLIVSGIMRSGTTLLEQILSKHPEIGAAGEQQLWQKSEHKCIEFQRGSYSMKQLMAAANEYCELLTGIAPGRRIVTEKNPANRTAYGLIHLAFPTTRILHMQRNPVDVAISVYTTMMRTGAPFMGNKDAIVFALKMHKRLTAHWHEVLPEERFRIVSYEKLTAEPELTTRDTIAYLGLPWADECLSPQSNQRTVATPSLWQVRQPVYTSSVERWRRYEQWLGPFAELIE